MAARRRHGDELAELDFLFNLAKPYGPLTREEEIRVIRKMRRGDVIAQKRIILSNLKFIVSRAKRYQGCGIRLIDLVEAGIIGALVAAGRFDETRGTKFISYAVAWINQAIHLEMKTQGRTVRLPVSRIAEFAKINKAIERLQQRYFREPTPDEIAAELGTSPQYVRELLGNRQNACSLDEPLNEKADASLLGEVLEEEFVSLPDAALEAQSQALLITRALDSLSPRKAYILSHLYGLDGVEAETQRSIAPRLHVTPERVRQLKEKAIRQLRSNSSLRRYWHDVYGRGYPGGQ